MVRILKYIHFGSNPKRADIVHSKHHVAWQPKFLPAGRELSDRLPDGNIGPATLIAALEGLEPGETRACRVVELAGARESEGTALHQCVEYLSNEGRQSELWLLVDDEEGARKHYEAFHGHEAALRFERLDPSRNGGFALDEGLLRRGAAELLFVHHDGNAIAPEDWRSWRSLLVAGGLAMVFHDEDAIIGAGQGWETLRTTSRCTLLQAPQGWPEATRAAASPPRWVLGEPESWAGDWVSLLDEPEVFPIALETLDADDGNSLADWPRAAEAKSIDFFCGRNPEDPSGERVASDRSSPSSGRWPSTVSRSRPSAAA